MNGQAKDGRGKREIDEDAAASSSLTFSFASFLCACMCVCVVVDLKSFLMAEAFAAFFNRITIRSDGRRNL